MTTEKKDFVDLLMAYEDGELSVEQSIEFFRKNKAQLQKLQGHYGRTIAALEQRGVL